jgi:hypothetical protein
MVTTSSALAAFPACCVSCAKGAEAMWRCHHACGITRPTQPTSSHHQPHTPAADRFPIIPRRRRHHQGSLCMHVKRAQSSTATSSTRTYTLAITQLVYTRIAPPFPGCPFKPFAPDWSSRQKVQTVLTVFHDCDGLGVKLQPPLVSAARRRPAPKLRLICETAGRSREQHVFGLCSAYMEGIDVRAYCMV